MSAPPFQIPGQPFFTELFQCWRKTPKKTLIRDLSGCCPEATLERFLYDVVTLRTRLWDSLDEHAKQALRDPNADNVFIAVLATPGYEYAVLCYTIYSVGAVIVPLSPGVLVEEAKYFLELCDAVLLTTGTAGVQHAQAISAQVGVQSFTFNPTQSPPPDNPAFVLESHDRCDSINMEKGFVLLYTSGTTGPPKGVLHSRRSAVAGLRSLMGHMGMSPHDTWLLHSPVHWMGGFWQFFITLLAGACVEFCASVCNPDWLMERLSAGDVSCMVMTPTMLDKMEKKLDTAQKSWSSSRYESVLAGIRALRVLATGSMPVGPVRRTVWKDLRGGKPLVDLYGMTEELAMIARTSWESDEGIPLESCGIPSELVTLKFNDEGELLVKSPALFTRYLSPNPEVMRGVFDSDGFYKTGDLARLEGGYLYIHGRASQDVIRFNGWKVFAPEVEEALSTHPYVSQVIILGVSDLHTGQRVAALLIPRWDNTSGNKLDLATIRGWLSQEKGILQYKLPTLLRVLRPTQKYPVTSSGKPIKPQIREELFNNTELVNGTVEVWDLAAKEPGMAARPFDWAGI
ncbi:hypothetical protein BDV32DRAFT_147515 [Aspergillus pseudonomiae]|uniref:Uncharacterized protein n=1 Tax=Aspergillus pseudonomiae TaxID=1506151 RepID=A0A5N7CW90_9EURO|nr:uncharacterized protein BDV37DRAFT_288508 [Aspergillus pseudonomiae]KAB8262594.1 hypothetical protein BDV32DRAFT_147515 [Aspergillus pseudonomiae]KAE8398442.1 hypothetical protein BDV37DRAFT_288508 [Aspergillus pseudonomiae]